jgi:hypothetical protein
VHPRLRRLFAVAGVACLTLSGLCFAAEGALQAAPLLAVRLHLPFAVPQLAVGEAAPGASPAASPSPSPKPRRHSFLGNGPVVFKGSGTYQLGLNRSSRNGIGTGYDNYSTALALGIERRTEESALSVTSAFGYGVTGLGLGSTILTYRTPKYALSYGQITGLSDSQLQVGGLARGLAVSLPLRNGDVSFIASTSSLTSVDTSTTYRVYGVRRNWNALGGFLSMAAYQSIGEQGGGRSSLFDIGFRHFGSTFSTNTELAASSAHGIDQWADGTKVAGAFQADLQGKSSSLTATFRLSPQGLETLTGTLDGGFEGDLALRKHHDALGDLNLSYGHLDDRFQNQVSHNDQLTLSDSKSWGKFSLQLIGGIDSQRGNGTSSLQHNGAIALSESLGKLALFETLQSSSTTGTSGAATQQQLSLGMARPLWGGNAAYQIVRSLQFSDGSTGTGLSQSLSYRHPFGRKTDVQLTQTFQRTANNGVPTTLIDTGLSVVRRLSNVVAVQLQTDHFHQTGPGAGSGMTFNASLVGPFGFGDQPNGGGRANPNLPAVIRGLVTVTNSTGASPFGYSQGVTRGYNNALVQLDGKITQRTDANGEFEFRFVSQGTHTLRLDPATITPGLIADRDFATIQVLGGQTSTVNFTVGNFAGVQGTILAQDDKGKKYPLGAVGVSVDGVQAVTTAPDGHYQIGRLSPGSHTVSITESTIPGNVAFLGDTKKTVTVTPGTAATLNFTATTLGSISGTVLAPNDGGFGPMIGLHNVYVVADPGDKAVITDDDGSFILDNMPPGTYTLSIDKDTIPEGLSVLSGPEGPLSIAGGNSISGVVFKLGPGAKDVVYTFNDGKKESIQVVLDPATAPPGAQLRIRATSNAKDLKALFVENDVFGTFPLKLDRRQNVWLGVATVPQLAKGDYAVTVTAHRKDVKDGDALLPVDPGIPLIATRLSPRVPNPGATAKLILKALVPLDEGDAVLFEDNYKVVLPKPAGRVFTFDIRVWRKGLPYSGTLVTKKGQIYPFVLR